jgi:hypothetical protein
MGVTADGAAASGEAHADADEDSGTEDAQDPSDEQHVPEAATPVLDSRAARPEPFEHTFGAQSHPAETAASDPGLSTTPAANTTAPEVPAAPEPSVDTPTATPEQ